MANPFEASVLEACVERFVPGAPRDTSPEAIIRNQFYLLYEVQKHIVIEHGRNHDPHAAQRYKRYLEQLAGGLT